MLKKLSTHGESEVFRQISPVAEHYGATIYRKIRIADVVDIARINTYQLGTYALQAHYDFVVADDSDHPLFALEFDGAGHASLHDSKKDEICRLADLALFRLDMQSCRIETAKHRFLEYLIHLWFLSSQFRKMKTDGIIPDDEPFMMCGFLRPDAKSVFDSEFDLLGPARGKLVNFCKKNALPGRPLWHLYLSETLLHHDTGRYVAFASYPMETAKLYGRAALGLRVPHPGALALVAFTRHEIGQFCTALAIEDLVEEMKLYQVGSGHATRLRSDVMADIKVLKDSGYKPLLACYSADDELAKAVDGFSNN
jgi:hypothetical protein